MSYVDDLGARVLAGKSITKLEAQSMTACFVLAVPGDIVLCTAGAALARVLLPVVRRQ